MPVTDEDIKKIARASADEISHRLNPEEEALKVERYHGILVAVGGINTKSLSLPDWDLSYIEFPEGEMPKYRSTLMRASAKIVKVTNQRIYFEQ